jgi:hypothetical protein
LLNQLSLSEVWQFEFVYYPQVLENGSIAHQPSWFGVGFLLCWFTGSLFLCLTLFLWGKVRDPSASSLLSTCYDCLLIVFQFWGVVWLWMLLTGSGDKFCGPLPALFQAAAYHPPAIIPSAFPVFVYWKFLWRSAPCFSFPSLVCLQHPTPSASCSFLFPCLLFSFFFFFFFFFVEQGFSLSRGLCWFIPGVAMRIPHDACCSTVGLPDVSQAGLEPASGARGALLFSQYNMAWRSLV